MRYEKATRDFYTFTCVGGLELFVLSDGGHTWCFHPQHTLRCYISLLYPCSIISSFYFVYTTLPLCLIPFCHMFCGIFESFISYSTIHSWSSSVLKHQECNPGSLCGTV